MKKKLLLIPVALFLFYTLFVTNGCTILVTESMRRQINDTTKLYTQVNFPNDSSMTDIESILSNISENTINENGDTNAISVDSIFNDDTTIDFSSTKKPIASNQTSIASNKKSIINGFGIFPNTNSEHYEEEIVPDQDYYLNITSIDASLFPDSIIVDLTVKNRDGQFVSGLAVPYLPDKRKNSDFWKLITDDCKRKTDEIRRFDVKEIRHTTSPKYNICFVLDHSPSMGENRCVSLQQTVRYVSSLVKENDYLSAIKFTDKSTTEVLPTQSKDEFAQQFRINGMASNIYGYGTDILKALDSAIAVLSTVDDTYKKIVFLFTDGESNMKRLNDVVRKYVKQNCKVFTICYGNVDMKVMNGIAKMTNGRSFKIAKVRDFANVFLDVYNELNNFYRISYQPSNCAGLHKISVNALLPVSENGHPTMKLFAADGSYDKSMFTDFADIGTMQLVDIEFEYNKASIDTNFLPVLIDIAEQLLRNQNVRILIAGHTDNVGNADYNQRLSLQRAESIKKYLVTQGVSESRIKTVGYGMMRPIVENDTDDNRKKNRRTEFTVIE